MSVDHLEALAAQQADAHGVTAAGRKGYADLAVRYAPMVLDVNRSGAWGYAVLSAAAHGRPWAINLSMEMSAKGREGAVRDITIGPHDALIDAMSRLVLRALTWAVEDAESYAGIGHAPIPRQPHEGSSRQGRRP